MLLLRICHEQDLAGPSKILLQDFSPEQIDCLLLISNLPQYSYEI